MISCNISSDQYVNTGTGEPLKFTLHNFIKSARASNGLVYVLEMARQSESNKKPSDAMFDNLKFDLRRIEQFRLKLQESGVNVDESKL